MSSRLSVRQRVSVSRRQRISLRQVAGGASATAVLSAAVIFVSQNMEADKAAAAKKSKDVSNYEYTVCPGENVQLECPEGDFYSWSPAAGLSNTAVANPIASPKKTTAYSATVYKKLNTVLSAADTFTPENGLVVKKEFKATAYDSYNVSLQARSSDANDVLQLQLRINDIPVLRTTVDGDVKRPASVIWDNIDETKAVVTVHVVSPEGYAKPVIIDDLNVVLLDRETMVTQVFVDKTCQISASR